MSILVESKKNGPEYKGAVEPTVKYDGLAWYDTVNKVHKLWNATASAWVLLSSLSLTVNGSSPSNPGNDRGVFGGGAISGISKNGIDYISISIPGNATAFGQLTTPRQGPAATSNGGTNRGLFAAGIDTTAETNTVEYITISVLGNATAFGILTKKQWYLTATSNGTTGRGVFGASADGSGNPVGSVDYVTIGTLGNALSFGTLSDARDKAAATSNTTNNRGVFGGGRNAGGTFSVVHYITVSTTGSFTHFGQLTQARGGLSATSNGTSNRGVFGGGEYYNTLDYITISTVGNATTFGTLTSNRGILLAATSNGTSERGVFAGGHNGTIALNVIDYITISTVGNASTFGTLTSTNYVLAATSNA